MATIRYYDPASGTWKTEQSTVPSIPGGTTLTISMIYGLPAALADLLDRINSWTPGPNSIPWSALKGAPTVFSVPVFCTNDTQPARPVPPAGVTYVVAYYKATAPQIGGTVGGGAGAAANDLWRPWNG